MQSLNSLEHDQEQVIKEANKSLRLAKALMSQLPINPTKSKAIIKYLKVAAEAGISEAQMLLGKRIRKSNPQEAIQYLSKAANSECPDSCYLLALLYESAPSPHRSYQLSDRFLQRAIALGSREAQAHHDRLGDEWLSDCKEKELEQMEVDERYEYEREQAELERTGRRIQEENLIKEAKELNQELANTESNNFYGSYTYPDDAYEHYHDEY